MRTGQVGGQCQPRSLCGLHACTHEQKRQTGPHSPHPQGLNGGVVEQQKGKGHDGQAAKKKDVADPQIRQSAKTQGRGVSVASVADERAQWRKQQRDCHRQGHPPSRDTQLDNHHPVERAHQEGHGHANGGLKQAQTQKTRQWQLRRCGIGKGHITKRENAEFLAQQHGQLDHWRTHSQACEV